MTAFFQITYYISFFSIMIICSIFAIVFARTKAGWILYGAGAAIQGLVLIGRNNTISYFERERMSAFWTIYVVILLVAAVIVYKRRNDF